VLLLKYFDVVPSYIEEKIMALQCDRVKSKIMTAIHKSLGMLLGLTYVSFWVLTVHIVKKYHLIQIWAT
jgi:hypothetical protein